MCSRFGGCSGRKPLLVAKVAVLLGLSFRVVGAIVELPCSLRGKSWGENLVHYGQATAMPFWCHALLEGVVFRDLTWLVAVLLMGRWQCCRLVMLVMAVLCMVNVLAAWSRGPMGAGCLELARKVHW